MMAGSDRAHCRIKICGITRPADALAAANAGADAIGLVFAPSPRRVTALRAREIVRSLPPFVTPVGVFVDSRPAEIRRVAAAVGLCVVQLHGDETPGMVKKLRPLRVVKAIRVGSAVFAAEAKQFARAGAAGILLDAHAVGARGGTGKRIDWSIIAEAAADGSWDADQSWILAGGLTPNSVAQAIRRLHPWGVDVSSGVESRPGIKSARKIAAFVTAVRCVSDSR
jgi:phosphoribosylanthranilate isomerase